MNLRLTKKGFPGGASGKEPTCQSKRPKRCGFSPWRAMIHRVAKRRTGLKWLRTHAHLTNSQRQHLLILMAHLSFFFFLALLGLSCSTWELHCSMWDLVPWPGIKPRPPALGAQSLGHWTTREVSPWPVLFQLDPCHWIIWKKILEIMAFHLLKLIYILRDVTTSNN